MSYTRDREARRRRIARRGQQAELERIDRMKQPLGRDGLPVQSPRTGVAGQTYSGGGASVQASFRVTRRSPPDSVA